MHLGVLGGGPIGVEMAVAAVRAGIQVTLIERSDYLGANVLSWGHVKLFSPNNLNHSKTGLTVLEEMGVTAPEESNYPTGKEFVTGYLSHLGRYLEYNDKCRLMLGSTVIGVSRGDCLKSDKRKENQVEFRVLVSQGDDEEVIEGLNAVVDATGTYGNHNWLGKGGMPAKGELKIQNRIYYNIPAPADKFADKDKTKVNMVVGAGASAITTLAMLENLGKKQGGVGVVWVTRRDGEPYTIIEGDALPQRKSLYSMGNSLTLGGGNNGFSSFRYLGNKNIKTIKEGEGNKIEVLIEDRFTRLEEAVVVDNVIGHVGYRPDTSLTQELQIHYCYASEGPMRLAAALLTAGGGGGDCLAQVAHGADTLITPETGLFILGMKSYGRASAFLLKIGHEQVNQVIHLLTTQQ